MKIEGKTVVITGASAGIGRACGKAFAAEGARCLLLARRGERLAELAAEIRERHGVEVLDTVLDVRDRRAVESFFGTLDGGWAAIDILVNNAGLARGLAPIHEGDPCDWDEMIDTNVRGLLNVTRAVLPGMVRRGAGHVINIGSIAGHEVYPSGNVYCATKHAVAALTRAMGIDLLGTGVRVSSVDPGMVETEFSAVRFHGDEARARAVYEGFAALRPEDVAEAVLFCATRPPHANVRELILMPSAQAAAVHLHREAR
ncbi:MAG: SDR family NAD(P)-dependent oxidoreductase [Acidobacteria bacterium]|nr:SDR family NAD(P)-dependent oxidoreductase [Acidobacteriota bacterium]